MQAEVVGVLARVSTVGAFGAVGGGGGSGGVCWLLSGLWRRLIAFGWGPLGSGSGPKK